jgi:hypothetical protein
VEDKDELFIMEALKASWRCKVINQDGKNYLSIAFANTDKEIMKVPELKPEETKDYESMGTASGMDLLHCIYLARKYSKKDEFPAKLIGYLIESSDDSRFNVKVTFYERKKKV